MESKRAGALGVTAAATMFLLAPASAGAHCDTMDGPVVTEARAALGTGDVSPLLKWVRAEDEGEIRSTFERTLEVRGLGETARELADRYFFETLVRVHRAGEGAPYTGLRPAGSGAHTAEAAADEALAAGSVEELADRIGGEAAAGVRERFGRVVDARAHVDDGVEAGRHYVDAYVRYVHYVLALHEAIAAEGDHGHGAEAHP